MKDINIVDIDYSAKNPEYKKEDKIVVGNISGPFIVPEEGPIYGDNTLRVIKGGIDLIRDKDWEPVQGVTNLSELTGKPVYLYVQLKDHIVSSGGELELVYQRVGKPVISVKTLLNMLEEMVIKGKPVDWETQITGKPKTYYPAWHSHDIKNPNELVGFGNLVQLFSAMTWSAQKDGPLINQLLNDLQSKIFGDLNYNQKLLWGAIMGHSRNYNNPHMLKPGDVDLGNVANNATATPQQDSDGSRSDLFSTPAGLNRVIEESAPESEDFLMQSELPFGYYGSGIYLPPPITGSFEGLGTDTENSMFVKEGNGWTVGLIRGYDGRVKNLYYIYTQDIRERNSNLNPWLHTYVQYQHPVITAAGKVPNMVIAGSNDQVMIVGDYQPPGNDISKTTDSMWWVCETNSTLDPNSHTLKRINLEDLWPLHGDSTRPGYFSMATVGDWVYVIQASRNDWTGFPGGDPNQGQTNTVFGENTVKYFYRFRRSDLTNPAVASITLQAINVSFDTTSRQRVNNNPTWYFDGVKRDGSGKIVEWALKYSPGAWRLQHHRKFVFVAVPNPLNKRQARVRVIQATFDEQRNDVTGGISGIGGAFVVDYDWDVETNTLTLDPNWVKPTKNLNTGAFEGVTLEQQRRAYADNEIGNHSYQFVNQANSWIPGFGLVGQGSLQTGTPPFRLNVSMWNRDGDLTKDYEWMKQPANWYDSFNRAGSWGRSFIMRSPFGVSGFPRFYSDLYAMKNGLRTTPIEMFWAENEQGSQQGFYRVAEPTDPDNQYIQRSSLQSNYIPKPIYGRKTNSSFGLVVGNDNTTGMINRPRRKNAKSRGAGLLTYYRRNIINNPGAANEYSKKTYDDLSIRPIVEESDGSIVINLDYDYTLDPVSKLLICQPVNSKKLRIPRAIYNDLMYTHIGAERNQVIDLAVDWCFGSEPGTGGDQIYSMFSINYHLTSEPDMIRSIVGLFTWEVASTGADGIRVARLGPVSFPFVGQNGNPLRPGTTENKIGTQWFTLNPGSNTWNLTQIGGLQVRYQHMEVLDFESEGPQNLEQMWFGGSQFQTPGNAATPRAIFRRRNNQITEATYWFGAGQAFNGEYGWQFQANPDLGWCQGVNGDVSGTAMDLLKPYGDGAPDCYVMLGATYVEGNWSVFINAEVLVTFNGYSMIAKMRNWDLRDLTDVYRNQTFYVYCEAVGSTAQYDITKILRHHSTASILVAVIKTDDFGIVTIERKQSFTVSGFPLTRARDMGVPVSSGAITDQGTYRFLKRSELYND